MESNQQNNSNDPAVMDVKIASGYISISEAKLRRLVAEKRIPHFRIDGRLLFSRQALEQWVQSLIVHPEEQQQGVAAAIWKTAKGV